MFINWRPECVLTEKTKKNKKKKHIRQKEKPLNEKTIYFYIRFCFVSRCFLGFRGKFLSIKKFFSLKIIIFKIYCLNYYCGSKKLKVLKITLVVFLWTLLYFANSDVKTSLSVRENFLVISKVEPSRLWTLREFLPS